MLSVNRIGYSAPVHSNRQKGVGFGHCRATAKAVNITDQIVNDLNKIEVTDADAMMDFTRKYQDTSAHYFEEAIEKITDKLKKAYLRGMRSLSGLRTREARSTTQEQANCVRKDINILANG